MSCLTSRFGGGGRLLSASGVGFGLAAGFGLRDLELLPDELLLLPELPEELLPELPEELDELPETGDLLEGAMTPAAIGCSPSTFYTVIRAD